RPPSHHPEDLRPTPPLLYTPPPPPPPISTSERALGCPLRRHEYGPGQHTPADNADVYSDRSHRAGVILWWIWSVWREFAVQLLLRHHKQSDCRSHGTAESANLDPVRRLSRQRQSER